MNFIELYVIFFSIALLLLVIEVMMGMALGIALAGSLAFFTLAILELIGLLNGLNSYLITGSITFVVYVFLILRFFKKKLWDKNGAKDAQGKLYKWIRITLADKPWNRYNDTKSWLTKQTFKGKNNDFAYFREDVIRL